MDFDLYKDSIRCVLPVGYSLDTDFDLVENRIRSVISTTSTLEFFDKEITPMGDGSKIKKRYYIKTKSKVWGELQIVYWPRGKYRIFYINIISYVKEEKKKKEKKARDNLLAKLT
ncbi:MAG: hypothetical protein ACMXYA_00635 [Candidatus Woesearchaeota archaeon]